MRRKEKRVYGAPKTTRSAAKESVKQKLARTHRRRIEHFDLFGGNKGGIVQSISDRSILLQGSMGVGDEAVNGGPTASKLFEAVRDVRGEQYDEAADT